MRERIVEKNSNEEFTLLRAEKGTKFLAKVSQLYFGEGRLRGDFDWAREEYVLYLDVPHRAEHISVEMTSHDVVRFLAWADIDSLSEIDGLEIECTVVSSGLQIIGLPDGIFSDVESHKNMTYPATVGGLRDRYERILWEDVAMKKYDGETATIENPSVKNEQLRFDVIIENNGILNVSLPFPAIYDESNKSVQLIESLVHRTRWKYWCLN